MQPTPNLTVASISVKGGVRSGQPRGTIPVWNTPGGLLLIGSAGQAVNQTFDTRNAQSFSLLSGSLPPGLTLNTSTGAITGTLDTIPLTTMFNFTIRLTSADTDYADQSFSIEVNGGGPVWQTASGVLGTYLELSTLSATSLIATSQSPEPITFSVVSGTMPTGVTLNSSGALLGTFPNITAQTATYSFIARASQSELYSDRMFNFVVRDRELQWQTPTGQLTNMLNAGLNYQVGPVWVPQIIALDDDGGAITYALIGGSLPAGVSLSTTGGHLLGTPTHTVEEFYTFVASASASNGQFITGTFSVFANLAPSWVTPLNIGTFTESVPMSYTLVATDSLAVSYALFGGSTLPAGTSLSASGVISGTPSSINLDTSFAFTVRATDANNAVSNRTFTMAIDNIEATATWAIPTGTIEGKFLNSGVNYQFGQAFVTQITAADPEGGSYSYSLIGGSLPSGVTLNSSNGAILGTPTHTVEEYYTFVARASGNAGQILNGTFAIFANVAPVWVTPSTLGMVVENTAVSATLVATDFLTPITYSNFGGASLPAGLTLTSTGILSGTAPIVAVDTNFTFAVRATDAAGMIAERNFVLPVDNIETAPVWVTPAGSLLTTDELVPVNITLEATDETALTYTVVSGSLPAGLSLNSSTGAITGTPSNITSDTTSVFTVRASDGVLFADRTFSITVIQVNQAPIWTTPSGNLGTVPGGSFADFMVSATDDVAITSYSIVAGALPGGLSLNSSTGAITGTANTVVVDTTSTFTVRASDGTLFTDRAFSITVAFAGEPPLQIQRSLRRRTTGTGGLTNGTATRTFGTASTTTSGRRFTFATWLKMLFINQAKTILLRDANNQIGINATNQIFVTIGGGTRTFTMGTNGIEDPAAWMHIVVQVDTANATLADRCILFLNGERVTAFTDSGTAISQNLNTGFLGTGGSHILFNAGDMILAETIMVDDQVVAPTAFGQNAINWQAIAYAGTYGNNGFRLTYSDNSTRAALGTDSSGRGNTFTISNFDFTTSSIWCDSLIDVPADHSAGVTARGNYGQINSLTDRVTVRAGGVEAASIDGDFQAWWGSMGASSGKFYYEGTIASTSITGMRIGFMDGGDLGGALASNPSAAFPQGSWGAYLSSTTGIATVTNGTVGSSTGTGVGNNSVIMVAIDYDAGRIWIGRDGTWIASGNPETGANPFVTFTPGTFLIPFGLVGGTTNFWRINFGARGAFTHTVPAGFVTYCSANLPTPAVQLPETYVGGALYTGTGTEQTVTLGFQPDILWLKNRTSATSTGHVLSFDSARGPGTYTELGTNTAAVVDAQGVISFNTNGFTIGTSSATNTNAATYGAYGFRADPTAGIDVVTWTGNGAASRTVNHDLGAAPHAIIMISDAGTSDRVIYHRNLANSQNLLWQLNTTANASSNSGVWNNTVPTASNFTVGSLYNANGVRYTAYVVREVPGFSRVGGYTFLGVLNPSFFNLGLRPAILWAAHSDTAANRTIVSTFTRFNRAPNWSMTVPQAESSTAPYTSSFLSNGWRIHNGQLTRRVYLVAFADAAQKYARADR